MSNETVVRTLRTQAWERAKGELRAMLTTYTRDTAAPNQFETINKAIGEFIENVEDNGLQE